MIGTRADNVDTPPPPWTPELAAGGTTLFGDGDIAPLPKLDARSSARAKIGVFRALFCGRDDVYATRWDPKSGSRQGEQRESIRAWNGHREDAVFVDSGVSQDPAPERVLVPSRELGRVRCPLLDRLFFKCPRREYELYASTLAPSPTKDRSVKSATRRSVDDQVGGSSGPEAKITS
jgi:hypothetical protein